MKTGKSIGCKDHLGTQIYLYGIIRQYFIQVSHNLASSLKRASISEFDAPESSWYFLQISLIFINACSVNYVFGFGLAIRHLVNAITIEAATIYNSENTDYKIMKFIIKKESPGCKNSKSRKCKSSILKPVSTVAVNSIFIEIRITQDTKKFF